jgi:hypothetical protein
MLRPALLALAAAGALVLPAAASAAVPTPPDCPLWGPHAAVEHAIPGTELVARDPYGGLLARNRLFFDFTVRGADADLANVASVSWALDGTVVRTDPRAPFEWKGQSGSSRRMPAGDHTIAVNVTPTGGGPVATTSFALGATDCQPAGFTAFLPRGRGASSFTFEAAIEGAKAPDLSGVSLTRAANVAVALPRSLRGRKIGTLKVLDANGRTLKTYTLKGTRTALSRGDVRARFVPGAQEFLRVDGLPAGAHTIDLRLVSGVVGLRTIRRPFRVTGTVRGDGTAARITTGGRYV